MTAPPENAIESARFIPLSFAALAVRTFAFVATLIPKYPASVENTAPTTKHTAVTQFPIPTPIRTNSTITKKINILYSAVKNAWAPSLIDAAISFIRSVPASCLLTLEANAAAKIRATIPRIGTTFKKISIISPPIDLLYFHLITFAQVVYSFFEIFVNIYK